MAAPRNNIPTRANSSKAPHTAHVLSQALNHPKSALTIAITALAGITAIVIAALPDTTTRYTPPVRARQYSTFTACLLTDTDGITSTAAKPVWAAMQAASKITTAQTSYLAIQGPATTANADTYLNTLALRGCELIFTVGTLPNQANHDRAASYPTLHFAAVNTSTPLPGNSEAIHADAVQSILEDAYHRWSASS